MQRTRLETFHQNRAAVVVDVVIVRRDRVGEETQLSQLVQRTRLETFHQNRVAVVVDVIVVRRDRVGVETQLSQLVQRTRLETFRQSHVVVVVDDVVVDVVVFVGAYSPVTGNRARQLRGTTPRGDIGLKNPVVVHNGPPSCCSRHGGRRRSRCFGRRTLSTRR